MKAVAIKTRKVTRKACTLFELLDESLSSFPEGGILAITSKVVSLCEGRTAPLEGTDKETLIHHEADYYMPIDFGVHGFHFTITRNTLIPMAGIDESNAGGCYVLWPSNPQKTANEVRVYLVDRFKVQNVGVLIVDSTCMPPMRYGTVGILMAHSGFMAMEDNIDAVDLFDRPFKFSKSGIGSGLAAAANVVMGEAQRQTPLVVIDDVPFVLFQDRDPSPEELQRAYGNPQDDLYGPFMRSVKWQEGGHGATNASAGPQTTDSVQ